MLLMMNMNMMMMMTSMLHGDVDDVVGRETQLFTLTDESESEFILFAQFAEFRGHHFGEPFDFICTDQCTSIAAQDEQR